MTSDDAKRIGKLVDWPIDNLRLLATDCDGTVKDARRASLGLSKGDLIRIIIDRDTIN